MSRRATAGSEGASRLEIRSIDRTLRDFFRVRPPRQPRSPRRRGSAQPLGERRDEPRRIAGDHDLSRAVGIDPPARSLHRHLARARRREPLGQHLRRRRFAEAQHHVGTVIGGEPGVPQDRVEGGDRRAGGHSGPGPGVGEHWPADAIGERVDARSGCPRAGHDHAPNGLQRLCEGVDLVVAELAGVVDQPMPRASVGPTGRQRPRVPHKGIAERQVQVHRASSAPSSAKSLGHRPRRERTPARRGVVARCTRVGEPSHRGAEQVRLVDRLRGADVLQLRRAVGCRGDERHARIGGPRRPRDGARLPPCRSS